MLSRVRRSRWILSAGAALLLACSIAGSAGGQVPLSRKGGATPPTYSWPEYAHDPQLSGVSGDPSISTDNASSLGVAWMANTGAIALGSPVVAWNAQDQTTLIYTSNEAGYFTAFSQATHQPVWSIGFGGGLRSTPLVEGPNVWLAPTSAHRIYKLNAGTGSVECSAPLPINTDASPMIATPPGGSPTVYIGVNDTGPTNGPFLAINEANCNIDFSVTPEPLPGTGGVWDGASYAVDADGEGLVLFGTADPDSAVYAVDAITGKTVWRYATQNPPPGIYDVGAGVTVSAPGVNGVADGVAYAVNKYGYLDALDLTTGALIWSVDRQGTISTPALDGDELIYGDGSSATCLNAVTGALIWTTNTGSPIDGSLDIVGPAGKQVAVYGDMSGTVHALSVATGQPLFSYQTGNFIVSAVAEDDGNLIATSADGFLYDFAPGGGTGPAPSSAVVAPVSGATLANPDGHLTISGTAGSASGPPVGEVQVAVQEGGAGGTWWDSATGTWTAAPYGNVAAITSPGSTQTAWSLALPVPSYGGTYEVFASAVGTNGVADIAADQSQPTAARSSFVVSSSATAPTATLSSSWVAPGSKVTLSGTGFQANEPVGLALGSSTLAPAMADGSGNFSVTVTIPVGMPFGPTSIVATGQTSGLVADAAGYITNEWSQSRSTATRVGAESNDSVLADHLSVSSGTFLTQAWSFNSGASIDTSPAVVDAVAYFANSAGDLDAVDIRTGMSVWTYADPSGAPLDSSPAVDPSTDGGIVIFGTSSGSVTALSTASGSIQWSTDLGTSAIDSSPAVSDGTVYVASTAGTVFALNEETGAIVWRKTLASTIHSSPAVDDATSLLVVGDDNGSVTALSTQTGKSIWVAPTAGSVVASPVIYNGSVYVGSGDEYFYAFNEATGAQRWKTKFSGPIVASAALIGSGHSTGASASPRSDHGYGYTLLVGDQAGHLATVSPSTGKATVTSSFGSAIVGTATTVGFTLADTANGMISGSKGPGRGGWSMKLPAGLEAPPTVINGEIFVAGEDGMLHCYVIPGQAPV